MQSEPKCGKRLMREYIDFVEKPHQGVVVTSETPENPWSWNVYLSGPAETPYEGGTFQMRIEFPDNYPFKPPTARFTTKIYHPQIKLENGCICECVYHKNWVPTKTMRDLINLFKSMLVTPDDENKCTLESEISNECIKDRPRFNKNAAEYTRKYAMN